MRTLIAPVPRERRFHGSSQAYPQSSRDCGGKFTERRYPVRDEVRAFVISSLKDMNYDVEGIDDATTLGPAGLDLESLALSDLLMRAEDEYSIRFGEEESEELALMNLGEFTTAVIERVSQTAASQQS